MRHLSVLPSVLGCVTKYHDLSGLKNKNYFLIVSKAGSL
jgi:hypothetical protein